MARPEELTIDDSLFARDAVNSATDRSLECFASVFVSRDPDTERALGPCPQWRGREPCGCQCTLGRRGSCPFVDLGATFILLWRSLQIGVDDLANVVCPGCCNEGGRSGHAGSSGLKTQAVPTSCEPAPLEPRRGSNRCIHILEAGDGSTGPYVGLVGC